MTFDGDPIFIGGDGRSGTTLLSLILDSHPELNVGPELHFSGPENLGPYVLHCLDLLQVNDPSSHGAGLKENPQLKRGVQFAKRCHRFGVDFVVLERLVKETMGVARSDLSTFEDRCILINAIGEHRRTESGARRWGIKIMRDIGRVHSYSKLWPRAQFIHVIRDGRDVAASQMTEHGTWGYDDVGRAAHGWMELIQKARKNDHRAALIEIRYEDVVGEPEEALHGLLNFLRLTWSDQVLRHTEVPHSLYDNPYNHPSISSIVKPINSSAVGRYRKDLSPEQITLFESIARASLDELGYHITDMAAGK
jgi:hypothetical protein